jgi:hypothetical protein
LIEIAAVSCHQLAVQLYQQDDGVHKHAEHEAWLAKALADIPANDPWAAGRLPPRTMFFHWAYQDSHQYPHGIADVVGYWAESKIFGGVVVFDRGESELEVGRKKERGAKRGSWHLEIGFLIRTLSLLNWGFTNGTP